VALPVGATIAGFRVLRSLGEGGMGAVYLVQHPDLPRQDVLKVMHGGLAQQPALRARFEHEARLAAGLNHPNIVQVFDRGIDGDLLWIRMQYVEGTDAARALADGPMHRERVLSIVRAVGSALDYAHRAGLLHRDVKPANILLAPGAHSGDAEHVMLTDFGIAKAMDVDVRLTGTGQAFLTPGYSAPERFGTGDIDQRIDVYSLGCVLFELLTGRLPFPYDSYLALIRAHDQEPVPDIRDVRPDLPPGVTEVIRTALAKDREDRYPTCRALAEAYAAALHEARPAPPAPPPPEPVPHAPEPAPPTQRWPVGQPSGPHRITVRVASPWGESVAGTADTATLTAGERRRIEGLVHEACRARAGMRDAPPPPGAAAVEIVIDHPVGSERIRYAPGAAHPPEWDRLVESVTGPAGPADPSGEPDAATGTDDGAGARSARAPLLIGAAVLVTVVAVVLAVVLWPSGGEGGNGTDGTASSSEEAAGGAPPADVPTVYGTEYNTGDALAQDFPEPGALDGMAGVTPIAPVPDEFRQRLEAVAPDLTDVNYSGESYDAVVVAALAVELAGTTDGRVVKDYVNGVTFGGTECATPADCLDVVRSGGNPDYEGVVGPLDFTEAGEPARAHFALLHFGPDNLIAPDETEYLLAGDEDDAAGSEGPEAGPSPAGDTLVLGGLLPITGSLQFLAPAMRAGMTLAVQEINEAGGVLGRPVELVEGDSGDITSGIGPATVDDLLAAGVDAIVGPASSSVTLAVLDQVTAAGVLMISPSATTADLSTVADDGLLFRISPSEVLEGQALGQIIVDHGHRSVGILSPPDTTGNAVSAALEEHLADAGIPTTRVVYDLAETDFTDEVEEIGAAAPDAVVLVGYLDDSSSLIAELNAQGIGPAR
jgi:ABC-type branched-subunit amino acid transport system substrate-binding protein